MYTHETSQQRICSNIGKQITIDTFIATEPSNIGACSSTEYGTTVLYCAGTGTGSVFPTGTSTVMHQ